MRARYPAAPMSRLSYRDTDGDVESIVTLLGAKAKAFWDAEDASKFTLSGDRVSAWVDSINAISVNNGNADNTRPVRSATSFKGRPGVTFVASEGRHLIVASTNAALPTGADHSEIWGAVRNDALVADTTLRAFFAYGSTSTATARRAGRSVSSGVERAAAFIGTGMSPFLATPFTGYCIYRLSTEQGRVFLDNKAGSPSYGLTLTTGTTATVIGALSSGASFWEGVVNSILVTTPLTDQEAAATFNFFTQRVR